MRMGSSIGILSFVASLARPGGNTQGCPLLRLKSAQTIRAFERHHLEAQASGGSCQRNRSGPRPDDERDGVSGQSAAAGTGVLGRLRLTDVEPAFYNTGQ